MGLIVTLNHLLNFVAPALALSVLMPVFARITGRGKASNCGFALQSGINFLACLAVLIAGLWLGGRDGKMLTYVAMVVACASAQWAMRRR